MKYIIIAIIILSINSTVKCQSTLNQDGLRIKEYFISSWPRYNLDSFGIDGVMIPGYLKIEHNKKGKIIYRAGKKKISRSEYDRYSKLKIDAQHCCPCIFKYYDSNKTLIVEGEFCESQSTPIGWYKEYYPTGVLKKYGHFKKRESNSAKRQIGNCIINSNYDGDWIYFNENGDTSYIEVWNNGNFISQIPESRIAEIVDLRLSLNGNILSEYKIKKDELNKIQLDIKYKNSLKSEKIRIKFEIKQNTTKTRVHLPNEYWFTPESFKEFNFIETSRKIIDDAHNRKEKILHTQYYLTIYDGFNYIKRFRLRFSD